MDAIRISKVPDVVCRKKGATSIGTVHLTAHHLLFHDNSRGPLEETWIPYSLISLVTRQPITIHGSSPIAIQTRTFDSYTFFFPSDNDAVDVFETVRSLTVVTSVDQLYAFYYHPSPDFGNTGWKIYNPREEFSRMGIGSRTKAWRFTDVNKSYSFAPTYPALLCVPTRISDATLTYAGKYRSKGRIPALTYLHWSNLASITRASQPLIGLTNARSIQDEKLVEAIFTSHHPSSVRVASSSTESTSQPSLVPSPQVYGATTQCLIIDARPTTNALANAAKGGGTENMDHYKDSKKAYANIENIHSMRESLARVYEVLREGDALQATLSSSTASLDSSEVLGNFLDRAALRRSGWLKHLAAMMEGTRLTVRTIHLFASHVLLHCSDGWDRTAQLAGLAELCLDPHYRTLKGFAILVEKDWSSFGHMWGIRCGHLSSEKIFLDSMQSLSSGGNEFIASVQNKFAGQGHLKETAPIFHQFLECTWNLLNQFPTRFEFNAEFLKTVHYHAYSCQFGTFLFNCERERLSYLSSSPGLKSVWDFLLSDTEREKYINPIYDTSLDDATYKDPDTGRWGDMGVLLPDPKKTKFWADLYGRGDEEMNGRLSVNVGLGLEEKAGDMLGPAEGEANDLVLSGSESLRQPSPSASPSSASRMNLSVSTPNVGRSTPSPSPLSKSVNAVSSMPNKHLREESFQPFDRGAASAFSMKTQSPSKTSAVPSSSSTSLSPGLDAQAMNLRMKSMWGKFSSNANAAFSAVQGAYDGVTKEFRNLNVQGEQIRSDGTREIASSRELALGASWTSEEVGIYESATLPRSLQSRPKYDPSIFRKSLLTEDNPWASTARRRSDTNTNLDTRNRPALEDDLFSSNPRSTGASRTPSPMSRPIDLPLDPTATDPLNPWSFGSTSSRSSTLGRKSSAPGRNKTLNEPPRTGEATSSNTPGTDPLGIAML